MGVGNIGSAGRDITVAQVIKPPSSRPIDEPRDEPVTPPSSRSPIETKVPPSTVPEESVPSSPSGSSQFLKDHEIKLHTGIPLSIGAIVDFKEGDWISNFRAGFQLGARWKNPTSDMGGHIAAAAHREIYYRASSRPGRWFFGATTGIDVGDEEKRALLGAYVSPSKEGSTLRFELGFSRKVWAGYLSGAVAIDQTFKPGNNSNDVSFVGGYTLFFDQLGKEE